MKSNYIFNIPYYPLMKNVYKAIAIKSILFVFFGLVFTSCTTTPKSCSPAPVIKGPTPKESAVKISYWNQQRRGANLFNSVETLERFQAAKKAGIEVVRLAPNKWLNGRSESERGDFLIGSCSTNMIPIRKDLDHLKSILDKAHQANLKVVLTMLSLPENRWSQHNNGKQQKDIWKSFQSQNYAIQFWTALADELKEHPALVGYNIKNEPAPERAHAYDFKDWFTDDYEAWYRKVKGTPADLNLFYDKVVKAIRAVDPNTPIILDSGFYGTPWAFKVLEPIQAKHILYSFHMYEPFPFTSYKNRGQFEYPGKVPTGEEGRKTVAWDKEEIKKFLVPIRDWQNKHNIPDNRVFVGELGVYRKNKGAAKYLEDVIAVVESNHWHWAFYTFRPDSWEGMDYELGTKKVDWKYWKIMEKGQTPDYSKTTPNPVFNVIKKALDR